MMTEGNRDSVEKMVRDFRRATRRKHNPEEKIRIVLQGLRGEQSIVELCRREGINSNLYYRWSKEFLEAGNGWSNDAPPLSEHTLTPAVDFRRTLFFAPHNRWRDSGQ